MKARLLFSLVLIAAALVLSSGNITAFAQEDTGDVISMAPEGVVVTTYVFPYGEKPFDRSKIGVTAVPWTDIAVHGTMWNAENRGQFSALKTFGWGTYTKAKAVGTQWVHIAIPYVTYLEDIAQKVRYVEFCAQSSAGATTKPSRLDIWGGATRFYTGAIVWPANNNRNCVGTFFTPGVWKEDLGISVQLNYANTADTITLYKAWASFEQ
jgi:hypothetical protein